MRRFLVAALTAAAVLAISAGSAFAARPTITRIDFSEFEPFAEADWEDQCDFPVDVEFEGHILVHEFGGQRLVEVDNWRTFQSYTAHGKTFSTSVAGPDHFWIAGDGTLYQAITGRSPSDGNVGRIVLDVVADMEVSRHGRAIDNPYEGLCDLIGED